MNFFLTRFFSNKYFANSIWTGVEKLARIAYVIFIGSWIARYLGPSDYGIYSYVFAVLTIFILISRLGLPDLLVRYLTPREADVEKILTSVFALKLISCSTLICLAWFLHKINLVNGFVAILSFSLLFQIVNPIEQYLIAKVQFKYVAICKVTQMLIMGCVYAYLIIYEQSLKSFIYVYLIEELLLALFFLLFIRTLNIHQNKINFAYGYDLLKQGLPLLFSSFFVIVMMRTDQIMIHYFLNTEAVGIYAAASRVAEAFYFIPALFMAALSPSLINAFNTNQKTFKFRYAVFYQILFLTSIFLILILYYFSPWLVSALYGPSYIESIIIIQIYMWALCPVFINALNTQWFICHNFTKTILLLTLMSCLINILLNWMMIPLIGLKGSAIATVLSQIIPLIALLAFDHGRENLKILFTSTKEVLNIKKIFRLMEGKVDDI